MRIIRRSRRGVATIELAVFFACFILALTFLAKYIQRAAQGGIRSNADSLGSQFSAKSPFTQSTHSDSYDNAVRVQQDQTSNFNQTLQ